MARLDCELALGRSPEETETGRPKQRGTDNHERATRAPGFPQPKSFSEIPKFRSFVGLLRTARHKCPPHYYCH
jgi:hypothetical protein